MIARADALAALRPGRSTSSSSAAGSPAPGWRSTPRPAATASRSSRRRTSRRARRAARRKLVHGGLRYLQNFDLGLVREALLERQIMVGLAPHLVKPLPLIVPAFDGARPGPHDRAWG